MCLSLRGISTDSGTHGSHSQGHSVGPLVHCHVDSNLHWLWDFTHKTLKSTQSVTVLRLIVAKSIIHQLPVKSKANGNIKSADRPLNEITG